MEKRIGNAIRVIGAIVGICVVVHVVNVLTHGYLTHYGLVPRSYDHLIGILTHPFIHGSWGHLISNMMSFSVLAFLVSRSGLSRFFAIFALCWAGSSLGTWIMGRESYHIGLSGIIYGLWGYLLVYAIMYRSLKSIVIAIIVMFLYGSFVWGLLPLHEGVSYEGHIFGGLSGGVLGYLYALKDKQHQTAVNKQVR